MTHDIVAIVFIVLIAAPVIVTAFIIRGMRREARNLTEFGKSLKRMRDESREAGVDFKPIASLARDMIKDR